MHLFKGRSFFKSEREWLQHIQQIAQTRIYEIDQKEIALKENQAQRYVQERIECERANRAFDLARIESEETSDVYGLASRVSNQRIGQYAHQHKEELEAEREQKFFELLEEEEYLRETEMEELEDANFARQRLREELEELEDIFADDWG